MKLTKRFALLILGIMLAFPVVSFAEEQINPWTDCGLGAMIFSKYPAAAGISNIIWDLGTTAVTSSAITPASCAGKNVAAAKFITDTYSNLEEDTVKGEGQHVTAMLDIFGCEKVSQKGIIESVKADFGETLKNSTYSSKSIVEKAQGYYNIVTDKVTGEYAQSCQAL